jgi:hypothetical protein
MPTRLAVHGAGTSCPICQHSRGRFIDKRLADLTVRHLAVVGLIVLVVLLLIFFL